MDENRKSGLIIAYYLSRFNDKAYEYILIEKVSVKVLHNPYEKLNPKKNTITVVQTTWAIDQKDLFQ